MLARVRRAGSSVHQARVALGLLLASGASGDNLGMIRAAHSGRRMPIAQKQGWLDDARLTAAIVYTARRASHRRDLRLRARSEPARGRSAPRASASSRRFACPDGHDRDSAVCLT